METLETEYTLILFFSDSLDVRVATGQKRCTEIIILHHIANFCATVLNIFSKKIFLTTPNVENKFWVLYETLESTGELKMMMRFYLCLHIFSELKNFLS